MLGLISSPSRELSEQAVPRTSGGREEGSMQAFMPIPTTSSGRWRCGRGPDAPSACSACGLDDAGDDGGADGAGDDGGDDAAIGSDAAAGVAGEAGGSTISQRIPQTFRPSTRTSFGHFSIAGSPVTSRIAIATE